MRFLSIYTPDPARANVQPSQESMAEMGKFMAESIKAGTLITTGGLLPVSKGGARMRMAGDEITVVDGPYAEAKEVIVGFAVLQAKTREDVIEMTRQFLKIAGPGECELQQIMDEGSCT